MTRYYFMHLHWSQCHFPLLSSSFRCLYPLFKLLCFILCSTSFPPSPFPPFFFKVILNSRTTCIPLLSVSLRGFHVSNKLSILPLRRCSNYCIPVRYTLLWFRISVFLDPLPCNDWCGVKKGQLVARTYCRFLKGNKFAGVSKLG